MLDRASRFSNVEDRDMTKLFGGTPPPARLRRRCFGDRVTPAHAHDISGCAQTDVVVYRVRLSVNGCVVLAFVDHFGSVCLVKCGHCVYCFVFPVFRKRFFIADLCFFKQADGPSN